MESAAEVLFRLANDYQRQRCYLQAAKCLQPVCSYTNALPATRATACIAYAQLLLDHFDHNHEQAMRHLHQAERELRSAHGALALRCEAFDLLARCHRHAGAPKLVIEAYTSGLEACTKGVKPKDRAAMRQWRTYFLFRMADAQMATSGPQAALEALAVLDAEGERELPALERALLALCRAVAHLHAGAMESADSELSVCASGLEEMMEVDGEEEGVLQAMRVHYFLLYTTVALAMGRAAHLQQDAEIPVLMQLQEALAGAANVRSEFCLLPSDAAEALGHLLHAALLRGAGKGSKAAVLLARAEELIEQGLGRARVDWTGGEEALAPAAKVDGRVYATLRVMAAQQRILAALLLTDLAGAGRLAAELVEALQRFPTMLAVHAPATHMLIGHYAQATGDQVAALAHFQAALRCGPQHMQHMAALAAASAELQREGGSTTSAAQILSAQGLANAAAMQALPANDRTTAQLVNGVLLCQEGDSTGARLLLSKALKQAHGLVGSTQLVAQVLNALAPVQQERQDLAGAQKMFESATTLLKSIGDLPSLVTTLKGLCALHHATGDAGRASKGEEYLRRKQAEVAARVDAALAAPQHATLMGWQL